MVKHRIIVGDVHGCYEELQELLDRTGAGSDDLVIAAGDFIDYGPQPAQVCRFFTGQAGALAIMGNHERKHVRGIFSLSQRITRRLLGPDYPETVRWLATLPYYYEDQEIIVVHAAVEPGVPLAGQTPEVLCGTMSGRRRLAAALEGKPWYDLYAGEKPIAFGHKVTGRQPLVIRNRIFGLDTGAAHGGWLTALVLPERRLVSVKARRNYWSAIKKHHQRFC